MDGAAITITVMTLAAAFTRGVEVDIPTALILSVIATFAACGASGVAGGSLLLIPMACSLFGIENDISMQVVGVGFIIGVIQDSVETALNSAGDVMFAATAEYHAWLKEGKELPKSVWKKSSFYLKILESKFVELRRKCSLKIINKIRNWKGMGNVTKLPCLF